MLLILVIILLLLGSSVVGSIYSNFMVFYSNFFESENYHKAYYASISALERGELVTKQRQPGYIGSGGFIMGVGTGSQHNPDGGSDKNLSGFSYLGNNENETSVFRTVDSRTKRIPKEGKGDIEWTLSYENPSNPTQNSDNYNKMDYENAEVFLLYYDNSDNNPYVKGTLVRPNIQQITGEIRLPQLLANNNFGYLNTGLGLVGGEGNLVDDDAIVDRQIRGNFQNTPFTIYSTQKLHSVLDGGGQKRKIDYTDDSVFRESDINNKLIFKFGDTHRSPINDRGYSIGRPTIISQKENEILNGLGSNKFKSIFSNPQFTGLNLRFSLLNFLQGDESHVYPFLEYYADFGGEIVPDKYYTIDGEGNFKDYQINTIIQKPTVKETVLGNFTSIFG